MTLSHPLTDVADRLGDALDTPAYSPDNPLPLRGYLTVETIFAGGIAAALGAAWLAGRRPARPSPLDLALLGVATQQLSVILTHDAVTRPVRAPFTRSGGAAVDGLVDDAPRGDGVRRAVGELLTCAPCVAPWIAAVLMSGMTFVPAPTRFLAGIFGVAAVSGAVRRLGLGR